MRLDAGKDILTGAMHFNLVITPHDYETARLSPLDKLVVDDCQGAEATIADTLLGLELIARRVEEAHSRPEGDT